MSTPILIRQCAQLPAGAPNDATSAATWTLRLLARRIVELTSEIGDLNQQLARAVNRHSSKLLMRPGVGPDCAAALLITAGDNPERLGSEASYAALCGASRSPSRYSTAQIDCSPTRPSHTAAVLRHRSACLDR